MQNDCQKWCKSGQYTLLKSDSFVYSIKSTHISMKRFKRYTTTKCNLNDEKTTITSTEKMYNIKIRCIGDIHTYTHAWAQTQKPWILLYMLYTLNRVLFSSKQNRIRKIFSDKTCVQNTYIIAAAALHLSTKNTRVAKCMTKLVEKNIKQQTQKKEEKTATITKTTLSTMSTTIP